MYWEQTCINLMNQLIPTHQQLLGEQMNGYNINHHNYTNSLTLPINFYIIQYLEYRYYSTVLLTFCAGS